LPLKGSRKAPSLPSLFSSFFFLRNSHHLPSLGSRLNTPTFSTFRECPLPNHLPCARFFDWLFYTLLTLCSFPLDDLHVLMRDSKKTFHPVRPLPHRSDLPLRCLAIPPEPPSSPLEMERPASFILPVPWCSPLFLSTFQDRRRRSRFLFFFLFSLPFSIFSWAQEAECRSKMGIPPPPPFLVLQTFITYFEAASASPPLLRL